jgi:hypothetical protein
MSRGLQRLMLTGALVAVAALTLSACGNSAGLALAKKACGYVEKSIAIYKRAEKDPNPAQALALRKKARADLETALPIATESVSDTRDFQALKTTLSEVSRVHESRLIPALTDQCYAAYHYNQVPAYPSPSTPGSPGTFTAPPPGAPPGA